MKTCAKCLTPKPHSEFYRANGGTSLFPECKECNRARARDTMRRLREADPEYTRRRALARLYGITLEKYDAMLAEQGGGCAICGATKPGGRGKYFHVDHDHGTDEVRGLLCHACNTGIGALADDVDRLMAAAAYLLARQDVLGAVVF